MKNWLSDNWDKLILGIVAAIIAGIVGFFSALAMLKEDMAAMGERIASVETELKCAVVPKLLTVDSNENRIRVSETEIMLLKSKISFGGKLTTTSNQRRGSKRDSAISNVH